MDADIIKLGYIACIVLAGGSLGGLISAIFLADYHHISKNNEDPEEEEKGCRCTVLFCIGRIIIGIGAAFSIFFAGLWINALKTDLIVDNIFIIFGVCIVSGVFGMRLLKRLGAQLEARVGDIEKASKQAKETAKKVEMKMEHIGDYVDLLNNGRTALGTDDDQSPQANADRDRAIEGLRKLIKIYPRERALFLLIGCLHRKKTEYDKAILILREFADNLRQASPVNKMLGHVRSDYADAYYNIACYHALKFMRETDPMEQKRLKNEVIENLRESIELLPSNKGYALSDPDFDCMKGDADFRKLLD